MYDDFGGTVQGHIIVPNNGKIQKQGSGPEFNTLDEPVRDTVVSVVVVNV
jgi:hypothetical protein